MALPTTKILSATSADAETLDMMNELIAQEEVIEGVASTTLVDTETASDLVPVTHISTAVAVSAPAPANTATAAKNNALGFLAETSGMDTSLLVQDFTTFPTIVLKDGTFTAPGDIDLGKAFNFRYMDLKQQFYFMGDVENSPEAEGKRNVENEGTYSYDGIHATDGSLVSDIIADWDSRKVKHRVTKYLMVLCEILDGEMAGDLAQIQLAPTMQGPFSAYAIKLGNRHVDIAAIDSQLLLGKKMGGGTNAWYMTHYKNLSAESSASL
jgi:hypothetical protein